MTPLQSSWLDALLHLKPTLGVEAVQLIYTKTELNQASKQHYAFHAAKLHAGVLLFIGTGIAELPEIEKLEILTSAAIRAFVLISNLDQVTEQRYCKIVGVCRGGIIGSRSRRWEIIYAQARAEGVFNAVADERKACAICLCPIASDESRPDVHEHCVRYARLKLKPLPKPKPIDTTGINDND